MAAAAATLPFVSMTEAQLRQWVEANPGRVNDRDRPGRTPSYVAVFYKEKLPLTVWVLDEKGADVNATSLDGLTPLHRASSLDILTALLDRCADPTVRSNKGTTVLMYQSFTGKVEIVARLLQDPRVRATVNVQTNGGDTALHYACHSNEESAASIVPLLLQAGANPALINYAGEMPVVILRRAHPTHLAIIALLEQAEKNADIDAEKAALLVKAHRLAVAAISNTVAPSCMQARVTRRQPLPRLLLWRVVLTPMAGGPDEDEDESRTLRPLVAFIIGVGGPDGEGMPRDVFREVLMDLLMPSWDPLRRKGADTGAPPQG